MDRTERSDADQGLLSLQRESFEYEEVADANEKKLNPPMYKLISVFIGGFIANSDTYLLFVTQDRIATEFESMTYAPLVLTSVNLGRCIALPVYGPLCDRYGSKIVLLWAYGLFTLGCTLAGLAHTFPMFLLGRVITGVGSSGMVDLFMVLVCELYGPSSVAKIRGYVIATGIIGRSFGGPGGGFITDLAGWRWSLLGQTPVALACIYFAWRLLPSSSSPLKYPSGEDTGISFFQRLNGPGIILFAICIGSMVVVIDMGGQSLPWNHPIISLLLALAVLSGIVFVINEWNRKEGQLIPPRLLLRPGLRIVYLGQVVFVCAMIAIQSSLTPYFTRTENLAAIDIAIRLLPQALGSASGALVGSHIISKSQKHRTISLISCLLTNVAFLLMVLQWADRIDVLELGYAFLLGFGCGLFFASQFTALIQYASTKQRATATGLYYLFQQVGNILGTTSMALTVGVLFRRGLYQSIWELLPDGKQENFIDGITKDPNFVGSLSTGIQTAVRECYQWAFSTALVLPLVCGLLVFSGMIIQREERK